MVLRGIIGIFICGQSNGHDEVHPRPMSDYNYHDHDRLPDNAMVAGTDEQPEKYFVSWGYDANDNRGASLTDTKPDRDDVDEIQYVFVLKKGLYMHAFSTVHRHDEHGNHTEDCERVPAEDAPAPEATATIFNDLFDAPVALKGQGGDDDE